MVTLLEYVRLSFKRLRVNILRSALTVLGIVIGIASVVALLSIGQGAQNAIANQFSNLGVNTITITAGSTNNLVQSAPLTLADLTVLQAEPAVGAAVPVVDANATVEYNGITQSASIIGTTPAMTQVETLDLAAGSFFSQFAYERKLPFAVVGSALAEDLGLSTQSVGDTVTVGGRTYVVIGLLQEQGGASFLNIDSGLVVPLTALEGRLVDASPDLSQIRVMAAAGSEDGLSNSVTAALRTSHNLGAGDDNDFRLIEATTLVDALNETSSTMTNLMAAIAAISLVVGGIGITNVMLVTVRERTREIGVRRALGATRGDIMGQFLVEAVVLSFIGGLLGLGAGVGAAYLFSSVLDMNAAISWPAATLALGTAAVVGVVAGLWPATQAASVEPTTALRYE